LHLCGVKKLIPAKAARRLIYLAKSIAEFALNSEIHISGRPVFIPVVARWLALNRIWWR